MPEHPLIRIAVGCFAGAGANLRRRDRTPPMSLLILLSAPSLAGLACMAAAITNQTLYPRLRGRACRVIPFPRRH